MRRKFIDNDSRTLFPLGISKKSRPRLWPTVTKGSAVNRQTKYAQGGTPLTMAVGSSREDSRARTSPLPVRERESGVVGLVFGLRCGELLGNCDPDGSLPRTLELSLFEGLPMLLTRLPKSGMTVSGKIYEQATWVRRTDGRGSGSWPTPQTEDRQGPNGNQDTLGRRAKRGEMYPTPTNSMMTTGDMEQARYAGDSGKRPSYQEAKMWPTPAHRDYRTGMPGRIDKGHTLNLPEKIADERGELGQLNPKWVEWLMGYPSGWTDLNASVTPLFLKSQSSCSGKSSPRGT